VSRKRNTNLFDLANKWKKTVFRNLDEAIAQEGGVVPQISLPGIDTSAPLRYEGRIIDDKDDDVNIHAKDFSDDEMVHPEFGRLSKTHNR
jgi:hypothetical protein